MQRSPKRRGKAIAAAVAAAFKSRARRDYDLVAASGIFDADYYLSRCDDLEAKPSDPLGHYLEQGWRAGRDPNGFFDGRWYLETYPEVARSGVNPLVDYLRAGALAGRDPSPRFDSSWYLARFEDVRKAGTNPLVHYLRWGRVEGRLPKRPGARAAVLGPYESWLAVNHLSDRDVTELHERVEQRRNRIPTISVITPIYNPSLVLLEKAVQSVTSQLFDAWELCLVNDGSTDGAVVPWLDQLAQMDERVRVKHLATNGGISRATNVGVEMAGGEVLVFLDQDDLLSPHCLAELAIHYADHSDADIVYSDDDKIDADGSRYAPQFKPDWSPVLLLSWMYMSHAFSVRRSVFGSLGGFRPDFDGSQDYDFALRAAEVARHVGHVPKILYHWRSVEGSTASGARAKPQSLERGRRAVQEALTRRGIDARAVHPEWAEKRNVGMFCIDFPDEGPSVTIIVEDGGREELLQNCLTLLRNTSYQNYDVRVLSGAGNLAKQRNEAVRHCTSDYVLFLGSGAEVTHPNWLSQMVGYARMDGVGAVGARLSSADGILRHAGKVHGLHEGLVGDAFRGVSSEDWGYLGFIRSSREYSAVSGTCLLTPRALLEELGGFDEVNFAHAFCDVDYCYRLRDVGRRCIYCAGADLRVQSADPPESTDEFFERANYRRLHGNRSEPLYSPNLSLDNEGFEIDAIRPETSNTAPVRLVVATHNLEQQGAPRTLADLVIELAATGIVDPVVLSPASGPLREFYDGAGIPVVTYGAFEEAVDRHTQLAALTEASSFIRGLGAEVVLANTLNSYWAVAAAHEAGVPSIWAQHESDPWDRYFDYLPTDMRARAYDAFADAYRVVYVAEATRRAWQPLQTRRNFKVVRHGIPSARLSRDVARWSRVAARKTLRVPEDAHVVSVIGTVCRRKGQLDLVRAHAELPADLRKRTHVYVAGKLAESDYVAEIRGAIGQNEQIRLTGPFEDPFVYYAASDILICTSRIESAPRTIVEAMGCGLPIVTTPVFGIPEMVRENVNALFYQPANTTALAMRIETLLRNPAVRQSFADSSRKVLASQPGFNEMVEEYTRMIRQAVNLRVLPLVPAVPETLRDESST